MGQPAFQDFSDPFFQGNGNAGHLGNSRVHGDQAGMASPWTLSRSGVSKQWPVGQIWPPCVFINKTVLTHSYFTHLCTVSSCFHATMAELCSCNRDLMYEYVLQSLTSLLSDPLQKKLTYPVLDWWLPSWFGAVSTVPWQSRKNKDQKASFQKSSIYSI